MATIESGGDQFHLTELQRLYVNAQYIDMNYKIE